MFSEWIYVGFQSCGALFETPCKTLSKCVRRSYWESGIALAHIQELIVWNFIQLIRDVDCGFFLILLGLSRKTPQ
jgi:hypothetical protein